MSYAEERQQHTSKIAEVSRQLESYDKQLKEMTKHWDERESKLTRNLEEQQAAAVLKECKLISSIVHFYYPNPSLYLRSPCFCDGPHTASPAVSRFAKPHCLPSTK
jgi:hypothetical protein